MSDPFLETFLKKFDDSQYPQDFLKKYEVMECLSHNETGETFLIREKDSGERFVAKCYAKNAHAATIVKSSLLKGADHAGLPALAGEYQNDEMYCVVRKYIAGQTLAEYVQENPISRERFLSIALQLCDILAYLHRQNPPVIHRDIKPQNIIIDEEGQITLIDFGISRSYNKMAGEDTTRFGTRRYAAPEQYGFAQTDNRSDIFSLGVLLSWLLNGHTDPAEAENDPRKDVYQKVARKCTSFDPRDRYQNVDQVKTALLGRTLPGRLTLLASAAAILLTAFLLINAYILHPVASAGTSFKEPLIEEAVRLQLGKPEGEAITPEELLTVRELFIIGDRVAATEAEYQMLVNQFAVNSDTFHQGTISTLGDLAKLKNLRRISLSDQNISDLTPLAQLRELESVDLRHNPVRDVSPLAGDTALTMLTLFDTEVTDLTPLRGCFRLTNLSIGYTPVETLAALDGLDGLQYLDIARGRIKSLDGIEIFPQLEGIYLANTPVQDLSPLLKLPRLQSVGISENMRSSAEAIEKQAGFTIQYQ